jgi:outer membrane protein OmpA-like peptidoglycan-associated protein
MNEPATSETWYNQMIEGPLATDQVKLDYALVLMKNGKYDQANQLIKSITDPEVANSEQALKVADIVGELATYFKDSAVYAIQNLNINTSTREFGPTYYDEGILFVSGRKTAGLFKPKYDWDDTYFLNLFYSEVSNGVMSEPKYFSNKLNTRFHEGPMEFYNDDTRVVFTRNNYYRGRTSNSEDGTNKLVLFFSEKESDNQWSKPEPFEYNSPEYSVGHPTLGDQGDLMIFASDMPGSIGGVDLWLSRRVGGEWKTPENLGEQFNTDGDEMFPFLSADSILFFASDAHEGLGGLDIFRVDLKMAKPQLRNLGFPINTEMDDFGLILKDNIGYFASNRLSGRGSDDIYQFELFEFEIQPVVVDGDTREMLMGDIIVIDKTYDEEILNEVGVGTTTFKGRRGHEYMVIGDYEGYAKDTVMFSSMRMPDSEGKFKVEVPLFRSNIYDIIAVRNYNKPEQILYANRKGKMQEFDGDLDMVKKHIETKTGKIGKVYIVNNIYYDLDKSEIRPDAASDLDKLGEVMANYPELRLGLGSHTDSRASFGYNEKLADRRVQSATGYLAGKGVDPGRVNKDSFGEYVLINDCGDDIECEEKMHQLNRRTEIRLFVENLDRASLN